MIELSLAFTFAVFMAGLLTFLAPCTLPLVPAYLAFISGVKNDDLSDPIIRLKAKQLIIKNSLAFVLGFSVIFIAFGVLAGSLGSYIGEFRGLFSQIGGVFIIIFGLMMLGVVNIAPLMREHKINAAHIFVSGKPASSCLIGIIFALGWTPCIGPVLGAILLLAATETTVLEGGFMLAIFSLGLAVPFIVISLVYARANHLIARISAVARWLNRIGAVFLILVGLLLMLGKFYLMVDYGEQIFHHLGLGGFFEWL